MPYLRHSIFIKTQSRIHLCDFLVSQVLMIKDGGLSQETRDSFATDGGLLKETGDSFATDGGLTQETGDSFATDADSRRRLRTVLRRLYRLHSVISEVIYYIHKCGL